LVSAVPSLFCVGAVHDTVAVPLEGPVTGGVDVTVMLNAGSDAVAAVPSATEMTTFMVVPVSVLFGLPESCPVLVLNAAHAGAFWMLKVIFPPSESDAAGVKLYWEPTVVPLEGVPVMLTVGVV
jgi:hypothetical protein